MKQRKFAARQLLRKTFVYWLQAGSICLTTLDLKTNNRRRNYYDLEEDNETRKRQAFY